MAKKDQMKPQHNKCWSSRDIKTNESFIYRNAAGLLPDRGEEIVLSSNKYERGKQL